MRKRNCTVKTYIQGASPPWEVEKATSESRLLSGRSRAVSHKGTVESFLLSCPSLSSTRKALVEYSMNYLLSYPDLLPLVCPVSVPCCKPGTGLAGLQYYAIGDQSCTGGGWGDIICVIQNTKELLILFTEGKASPIERLLRNKTCCQN